MTSFTSAIRYFSFLIICSLITACGGGGGGGSSSAPVTPTNQVFPIAAAYSSMITNGISANVSFSGKSNGSSFTGNGVVSMSSAVAAVFEGQNGLRTTQTIAGNITVNGSSQPFNSGITTFYDSNYFELGSLDNSDGTYSITSGVEPLPTSAHVNDAGALGSSTVYSSATKAVTTGTAVATYSLDPDSATTVIFHVKYKNYDANHVLESTEDDHYRVDTNGNVSFVSIQYSSADGGDTFNAQASGGPVSPVVTSFPVEQAFAASILSGYQRNVLMTFSLAPTLTGTCSCQISASPVVDGQFEGQSVLASNLTTSGTLILTDSLNGQTSSFPLNSSAISYYSPTYLPLGQDAGAASYTVVTSASKLPAWAKVGDTGPYKTSIVYSDSSKATVSYSSTTTYSIQADTQSSVILDISSQYTNSLGVFFQTDHDRYRLTSAGEIDFVSYTAYDPNGQIVTSLVPQ